MAMGLIGGIGLLACAAAIFFTTRAAARGTLPRGMRMGIRTAITQASDEAWVAAHGAAMPCARLLSIVATIFGVALIVAGAMASAADTSPAVVVLFILGYGSVLIGAWPLVRIANNGASRRQQPGAQGDGSDRLE
ncbi:MAG TPA: SdpI family protein [Flexivirga sp.]|uniref:SdpI family protein n=1 Tax=Flexivirga sp. TaxID=1962927 RepID=UPI002CBF4E32|nr:SdpI family protein [Flexivirga sp.]HWC23699.1 SdpI family protein [Flexivirga sp.]